MKSIFQGMTTALCVICFSQANAQVKKISEITKEDLIADFNLIADIIKKQHPNPYKFIDSSDFNQKVDSFRQEIIKKPELSSFSNNDPIHLVKDVHLSLSMTSQQTKEYNDSKNYIPLCVVIERAKAFINIKGGAIPFGAEVISINNKSMQEILKQLSLNINSDGYIETGIESISSNFAQYYSMLFAPADTYTISYLEHGKQKISQQTLKSITPTALYHMNNKCILPLNILQQAYYIYDNYFDDMKVGLLTVNTFDIGESTAYKSYSEFFREVKKRGYKSVIIDIRSNHGGDPGIAALLYSFLSQQTFRNAYAYKTKTIDIAYPEYIVDGNERNISEEDIREQKEFMHQRFDKDSSGFYVGNARLKDGLVENFPSDKDAFGGNVYVLTGSGTISAATYFASLVQRNKRGLIIGKETRSGAAATTAAWFFTYKLPRTQFTLTIPRSEIYFHDATTDNGRGVLPDIQIPLTLFTQYLIESKDPELEYTLRKIIQ